MLSESVISKNKYYKTILFKNSAANTQSTKIYPKINILKMQSKKRYESQKRWVLTNKLWNGRSKMCRVSEWNSIGVFGALPRRVSKIFSKIIKTLFIIYFKRKLFSCNVLLLYWNYFNWTIHYRYVLIKKGQNHEVFSTMNWDFFLKIRNCSVFSDIYSIVLPSF